MFWFDFSFRKWILSEGVNTALLTAQYKKLFPQATDQEINDKIQLAIAADPTPMKKYVGWIFREFINNRLRLPEDTPVTLQQIALFDKSKAALKRLGKELDITKYDRPTLWKTLGEIEGVTSKRAEKAQIKQEGSEKLYEDGEWLVIKMTKPEACSYYAKGTKWCTSDPETAGQYLKEGPLFMIYRNGKVYAQAHVESEQLMDPQDVPIQPNKVPEKLREIILNYVHSHDEENQDFTKQRNQLFGIKEKTITYPDGHYWGTSDHEHFFLMNPDGEDEVKITVYEDGIQIDRPDDKTLDKLIHSGNWKDIETKYKSPSNWNKYIIDFIAKQPKLKEINILSDKWNLGDLSEQDRETLFKARPDLQPKVYLKDGDEIWTLAGLGTYVLLDNYHPVLSMQLSQNDVLSYGSWHTHRLDILNNKPLVKADYSEITTAFLLKQGVKHHHESVSHYNGWKFQDLNKEDQAKILKAHPDFLNDFVYHSRESKDRAELLGRMTSRSAIHDIKPFGDDYVVLDKHNSIDKQKLTSYRSYFSAKGLENLRKQFSKIIKSKIPNGYEFEQDIKKNNIEKIRHDYPFFNTDLLDHIDKDSMYKAGTAFSNAVGDYLMSKAVPILFRDLEHFNNDKFKVALKDNNIDFIYPYEDLVSNFKQDKSLTALAKEYKDWYNKLEIPEETLQQQLENIPMGMDDANFLQGLKDYSRNKYDFSY